MSINTNAVSDINPKEEQFHSTQVKRLIAAPYNYEFTKAVHILRRFFRLLPVQHGGAKIRFRAMVRYATSPAEVHKIEIKGKGSGTFQPILWVNFTGIAGRQGPLALIYTERVFRNLRAGDTALSSFLDIFNHRIISLFYESNNGIPGYADIPVTDSLIGDLITSFGGVDSAANNSASDLLKYLISYKCMFWQRIRSTTNLKQILCSFLDASICISEFCGDFFAISAQEVTRIGGGLGNMNTLGADSTLGTRVWRQNVCIKIVISEVTWEKCATFNPYKRGENFEHLVRLCRAYVPAFTTTRFFIKIDQKCKRGVVLGGEHNLGFDTWIGTKEILNEPPRMIF
ncbi:MAG: type VI secretion system baseplate subunit TssG [Holosporales bacterium]|jgi:type VI secretion system protein ImpH|nr:type VI secretion system baseplate subunit TssG [Holosporales bacterium]